MGQQQQGNKVSRSKLDVFTVQTKLLLCFRENQVWIILRTALKVEFVLREFVSK